MKNIYDILSSVGITIPDDKKEAFNHELAENYKTVAEVDNLRTKLQAAEADRDTYKDKYDTDIAARDADLATIKAQLEEAGQSKDKLTALQQSLADAQSKYETDKADWEKKLNDQQYNFSLNESARELNFSSKAAKKVFIDELMANPLQVKDGVLLGFNDYVDAYKEANPDSFVIDNPGNQEPPLISGKSGGAGIKPGGNQDNNPTPDIPRVW